MNKTKVHVKHLESDYGHRNVMEGRRERKDPTLTFIGGLIIGLVVGGLIGAVIEGIHLMNVLGI